MGTTYLFKVLTIIGTFLGVVSQSNRELYTNFQLVPMGNSKAYFSSPFPAPLSNN